MGSADAIFRRARQQTQREMLAIEEKHLPSRNEMAGFCSGLRCVCSLMAAAERPCIPCRSRAYSAEFRAYADSKRTPPPREPGERERR